MVERYYYLIQASAENSFSIGKKELNRGKNLAIMK
jgi:hypothetical protein